MTANAANPGLHMLEQALNNGEEINITLNAQGDEDLKVTICWTDTPLTNRIQSTLNNRTKSLVNDLDLRITRISNSQEFHPWTLDVENPSNLAVQTTDNDTDNVEQVLITAATAQNEQYLLTISHKGTLKELSGTNQEINAANQVVSIFM